ncbi:MAG TPA: hypothetical protein VF823_02205, partial [Anaerolineales bacterium]
MKKSASVSLLSVSAVSGLIGMLAGYVVGMLLATLIRVAQHLPVSMPGGFGFSEPAWVVAALFGAVGFMIGTGVLNDWFAAAKGE